MHERPADFARIAKFVTPVGYVAGTMAGLKADQAFMDYTFIHFTGFSDSKAGTWSPELCGRFGLDRSKLPEIVEPWRVVGEVTPAAAAGFSDWPPGTAVAAGCGDTAACALGAGAVKPGMVFDSAGTAAVLAACTDQFVADRKHRALLCMHSGHPGGLQPAGLHCRRRDRAALVPRSVLQYAARRGAAEGERSVRGDDRLGRDDPAGGRRPVLLAAPGRADLSLRPPAMRGAWIGFSWGHSQAHFCRALAGEHRLRVRVLPGHPGRSASRPGAG